MTVTRKGSNGQHKASVKRVTHAAYHEYETPPMPAQVVITPSTQAHLPMWRLVAIIGSVIGATAVVTWRVAAERTAISDEVSVIKTEVKLLSQSVTAFSESVKELNGNLKWMSAGAWSRGDMQSFCKNLEIINSGKVKCPAVDLMTGSLK